MVLSKSPTRYTTWSILRLSCLTHSSTFSGEAAVADWDTLPDAMALTDLPSCLNSLHDAFRPKVWDCGAAAG